MSQQLRHISLFSGIGGIDEGLHQAGFEPLFCCELDGYARASLRNWIRLRGVAPVVAEDVTEVDPSALRERLGLEVGQLDLLAGGPPCQSFSLIGKRGSLSDPRGLLLFEMVRFAKAFLPRAILVEQVKGLRSAATRNGGAGSVLDRLLKDLGTLGYAVQHSVLRASDFGVPQHRERLFVLALRGREKPEFPAPTHIDPTKSSASTHTRGQPHTCIRTVLADLPPPVLKGEVALVPNHVDATPARDRERIHGVPEGRFLAGELHLPASQRMRLNPKKDTTKFRRLRWDAPSLTLRGGEAFYHPVEDRYITPREAMRIHGFPDALTLEGPIRGRSGSAKGLDQHRQVANAVPPLLAEVLGRQLAMYLQPRRFARSQASNGTAIA